MADTDTPEVSPAPGADTAGDGGGAGGGGGGTTLTGKPWWATFWVAIGLLLLFAVVAVVLLNVADNTSSTDTIWARYVYVFGAVEAIVFGAVGWLFGREVHRAAAEQATKTADAAKNEAAAARDQAMTSSTEAAKGRALAAAVRTSVAATPQDQLDGVQGASASAGGSQLTSLRLLADELFPSNP